jgi:hypothetical protein
MIATTLMGFLAVFFAFLARYRNMRYGLTLSFLLIFLFLALRYQFGNDYNSYLGIFEEINSYASFNLFDKTIHVEPGWIVLCKLFKPLGFFAMVAVLALLNCIIYYRFIKSYLPVQYYWLAVFIYLFDPGFMLTHASAMRQSLTIAIFIFSIKYIFKKDAIRYILCIVIAWFFHSSALVLLPVYFLGLVNWKINKVTATIFFLLFLSLFVFSSSIMPYINQLVSVYFDQYEFYQDPGSVGSGLGILYVSITFLLILYFDRFQDKETSLLFKIGIISFIFIPLSLLIQLIGRMGMYFKVSLIIAYPLIQMNLHKKAYRKVFICS